MKVHDNADALVRWRGNISQLPSHRSGKPSHEFSRGVGRRSVRRASWCFRAGEASLCERERACSISPNRPATAHTQSVARSFLRRAASGWVYRSQFAAARSAHVAQIAAN